MGCDEVREQFSLYYDSQADDTEEIAAHLFACTLCAAEYEEFCSIINEIETMTAPEPPPGFHSDLMVYVKRESKKVRSLFSGAAVKRYSLVAAAAVLLAVVWVSGVFTPETQYFVPIAPAEASDAVIADLLPPDGVDDDEVTQRFWLWDDEETDSEVFVEPRFFLEETDEESSETEYFFVEIFDQDLAPETEAPVAVFGVMDDDAFVFTLDNTEEGDRRWVFGLVGGVVVTAIVAIAVTFWLKSRKRD